MIDMAKVMEVNDATALAGILSAIGGISTGIFSGIRIGKSKQIEEIKELITQYKDANDFTKNEVLEVKSALVETRQMHKECEEGRAILACRVDELADAVKKLTP
jgi:hypothetical protein